MDVVLDDSGLPINGVTCQDNKFGITKSRIGAQSTSRAAYIITLTGLNHCSRSLMMLLLRYLIIINKSILVVAL
jgi:hypothetical protein